MENLVLIVKEIRRIASEREVAIEELESIEQKAEKFLNHNPNCVELWLRLALLEFIDPVGDYPRSIGYLRRALELNQDNEYIILLLSFIEDWYGTGLDSGLITALINIPEQETELKSMSYYLIAWSYQKRDIEKFEEYLRKSITSCSKHVKNLVDLGQFLIANERVDEGKRFISKAISNVTRVYLKNDQVEHDLTDIDQFLNERLKGIFVTEELLEGWKRLISS